MNDLKNSLIFICIIFFFLMEIIKNYYKERIVFYSLRI